MPFSNHLSDEDRDHLYPLGVAAQVEMDLSLPMCSGATLSPDRLYRYELWRIWDSDLPLLAVCGLNPSTADEKTNDPTITRCINFAKAWGYGGIYMINLFGYRSTDPKALKSVADPIGPDNDRVIIEVVAGTDHTIVAWGVNGALFGRDTQVLDLIRQGRHGHKVYHLGLTKGGHPKHPLYLRADTRPIPYYNESAHA